MTQATVKDIVTTEQHDYREGGYVEVNINNNSNKRGTTTIHDNMIKITII